MYALRNRLSYSVFQDDISKKDWKCHAVVFYTRDEKVVGVLTFNLPMELLPLAREVSTIFR